ncbi:hypothetical protein A1OW_02855 [Enterovibrio norvegicus]|uniref:Peptidase M15 n=1 Tax=Enterovibrio norvegicus DSM 15893 TaxID=1121869 RepID=A0A1I5TEG0_9GAMM|nr:hypothetical protein [Enterovibrio norvegicus]OEF64085.1 hypothetical protein A1OW_02855 [Enterovibrio norvegicus]SFP81442.1 hypothetical protein SAMN03084138_03204 [Enterovibrio norvegicus DSM 15893]
MRQELIDWHRTQHPVIPSEISNRPLQEESTSALIALSDDILTPLENQFGSITITYGFTSNILKNYLLKHHPGQMAPSLDQHAASERNAKGNLICKRQGAACDLLVEGFDKRMDEIAKFVVTQLPFDRLYFYGKNRPIHVSIGPENSKYVQIMKPSAKGHAVPVRRGVGVSSINLFES